MNKLGNRLTIPPLELVRTPRASGWLALFAFLVVTQLGHVGEHVVQIVQLHVLNQSPEQAHGVVGQLDIEWVHFIWNSWVLLAVILLVRPFWKNAWLWAAMALAAWHLAEHVVIMFTYLRTGTPGDPGLLAAGGRIGGGLSVARPDLHFLYNVVETIPLLVAIVYELKRRHSPLLEGEPVTA